MISVIIATYNASATIEECLTSLREQTHADFEVLLSDGGSSDDTLAIAQRYSDVIAHIHSAPDCGVYDAWNKVIPIAKGEWIMFLGADDKLHAPATLAKAASILGEIDRSEMECSYAYGMTEFVQADRVLEVFGTSALPDNRLDPDLDIPFSHTGLLHHRSLFDHFGLFDADFKSAGDYEYLIRTTRDERTRFHYLPVPIACMAAGGMSNSFAGRAAHYEEMHMARAKLGMDVPAWLQRATWRAKGLRQLNQILHEKQVTRIANAYRQLRGKTPRKLA